MSMTNVPIDSQEITLRRWRVIEVELQDGTRSRHVWGHDKTNEQGLASSTIIKFNSDEMIVITRSGRNYRLLGLPGNARIGRSAWRRWCSKNGVVSELDVTNEYLNPDQLSTLELGKVIDAVVDKTSS
jgi:hypothetical protein